MRSAQLIWQIMNHTVSHSSGQRKVTKLIKCIEENHRAKQDSTKQWPSLHNGTSIELPWTPVHNIRSWLQRLQVQQMHSYQYFMTTWTKLSKTLMKELFVAWLRPITSGGPCQWVAGLIRGDSLTLSRFWTAGQQIQPRALKQHIRCVFSCCTKCAQSRFIKMLVAATSAFMGEETRLEISSSWFICSYDLQSIHKGNVYRTLTSLIPIIEKKLKSNWKKTDLKLWAKESKSVLFIDFD